MRKISDMIGKNNKKECFAKAYGTPPIIHGGFIYRCQDCNKEWIMWLEEGVEGEDKIMPCPFTIGCECGGWAEHVDWHRYIKFSKDEHRPIAPGAKYFALDHELGHGQPCVYMGEGVVETFKIEEGGIPMLKAWRKWKTFFGNQGFVAFLRFYISGKREEKAKTETAKVEMKQAIEELEYKKRQFMLATAEFEPVAWHELRAAEARVDALIKEKKGENH